MNDDAIALRHLLQEAGPEVARVLLHYLYFPARKHAAEAAVRLRSMGFKTEERLGADGANWLVLARHEVIPSESLVAQARSAMEGIAQGGHGEYDGWEAEARS